VTWQWVVFTLIICATVVIVAGLTLAFRDNQVILEEDD